MRRIEEVAYILEDDEVNDAVRDNMPAHEDFDFVENMCCSLYGEENISVIVEDIQEKIREDRIFRAFNAFYNDSDCDDSIGMEELICGLVLMNFLPGDADTIIVKVYG